MFNKSTSAQHLIEYFSLLPPHQVDEDGNGLISVAELGYALETCGIKMPGYQLREIISKLDTDKDGSLNMEEFRKVS